MKNNARYHKKFLFISGGIFLILSILKLLVYNQETWLFSEWYTNAIYALAFGSTISNLIYLLMKKTKLLFFRWEITLLLSYGTFEIVRRGHIFFCTEHMGLSYNLAYTVMLSLIAALGCAITFMLGEKSTYFDKNKTRKEKSENEKFVIEEAWISISKVEERKLDNRAVNLRFNRWFYTKRHRTARDNNIIAENCSSFNVIEKFGQLEKNEEFYNICLKNMVIGYFIVERQSDKLLYIKEFDVMMEDIGRIALGKFFALNQNMNYRIAVEEMCSEELNKNLILSVVKVISPNYKVIVDGDKTLVEFAI